MRTSFVGILAICFMVALTYPQGHADEYTGIGAEIDRECFR